MKLYLFPGSTACRPVELFLAEAGIRYEPVTVDILSGKQFEAPYRKINPSSLVPTLDDDGFILTESSAILKYLADKVSSPAYSKDLRTRARINEVMDWFNTQFYREYGYHFVYPQTLASFKLEPEAGHENLIARGKERARFFLGVLNDHWLGDGRRFVCGEEFTIADCQGASILTLGEWIGQRFEGYPNVHRWIGSVKARPSWKAVQEGHSNLVTHGFPRAEVAAAPFIRVKPTKPRREHYVEGRPEHPRGDRGLRRRQCGDDGDRDSKWSCPVPRAGEAGGGHD